MDCHSLKIYLSAIVFHIFVGHFFVNESFAEAYSYDSLNRLTQVIYDSSTFIQYTYDAMGNLLTTKQGTHPPPSPPKITKIVPGYRKATIYFSLSTAYNNTLIASYTAKCVAAGQITRFATSSGSPITVSSLTLGVKYTCSVTATDSVGFISNASATTTVTPLMTADDGFNLILLAPVILDKKSKKQK